MRLTLELIDEIVFISVISILYLLRYTEQSAYSETYGLVVIGLIGGVLFAKLSVLVAVILKQVVLKCRRIKKGSKIKPSAFVSEISFS